MSHSNLSLDGSSHENRLMTGVPSQALDGEKRVSISRAGSHVGSLEIETELQKKKKEYKP